MDGHAGTCNEKVFRFRVCGTDGHSSRFRVGTKRRRTRRQLDVRGEMGERDGREGEGKKKERMREKGKHEDPRRDKPKSSTREGAIGKGEMGEKSSGGRREED